MTPASGGRIVFAGGGHAHLYSLLRTGELTARGYDVTLVAPEPLLHYSGMAPGVVSGIYPPDGASLDVRFLVESGGGSFVRDSVTDISAPNKSLKLHSGKTLNYDVLSVCLGSTIPESSLTRSASLTVKPVENLLQLHDIFTSRESAPKNCLVVGGGPAGCEVACNLERLAHDLSLETRITVADLHDTPLPSAPAGVRKAMLRHLSYRGIEFLPNACVISSENGIARTGNDRYISHDFLLFATGIRPPPLFRNSNLLTGRDNGLWVNSYLQNPVFPDIFGGGDCISYRGNSLPRLGVFAIRQGPILFDNIVAYLEGLPLRNFEPQSRYLYVLNLGDGTGIAVRGKLWWKGRASWLLKRSIDKRFMATYRHPNKSK